MGLAVALLLRDFIEALPLRARLGILAVDCFAEGLARCGSKRIRFIIVLRVFSFQPSPRAIGVSMMARRTPSSYAPVSANQIASGGNTCCGGQDRDHGVLDRFAFHGGCTGKIPNGCGQR